MRDLCKKAPSVADYLIQEIRNYSSDDAQPEAQDTKKRESGNTPNQPSMRRKQRDRTYQPPRSFELQPVIPGDNAKDPDAAFKGGSLVGDDWVTYQPIHDEMAITQEQGQPRNGGNPSLSEMRSRNFQGSSL